MFGNCCKKMSVLPSLKLWHKIIWRRVACECNAWATCKINRRISRLPPPPTDSNPCENGDSDSERDGSHLPDDAAGEFGDGATRILPISTGMDKFEESESVGKVCGASNGDASVLFRRWGRRGRVLRVRGRRPGRRGRVLMEVVAVGDALKAHSGAARARWESGSRKIERMQVICLP